MSKFARKWRAQLKIHLAALQYAETAGSKRKPRASQLAYMAKFSSTVALLAIAFVFDASQHVWRTEWGSSYGGTTATTTTGFIPADRSFAWNPGLLSKGGIPSRTQTCATLVARRQYSGGA